MAPADFPAGGYLSDYLGFWGVWLALVAATWWFFRATKGRRGAVRLVSGNLLVLLVLLWTAVLAAETYLRYVYDRTDAYALMLTNRSWFRRHVNLNERGFRDVSFDFPKAPGTVRVACVGDSFTMGWGLDEPQDSWPSVVRTALDRRAPGRYEVRNYGVPGYTTGDELNLIEEIVPADEIDHVILGYCLNDPDDLLPREHTFDRETAPRLPWFDQCHSFLADRLWYQLVLSRDPRLAGFFEWEKEAYDDPKIFGVLTDRLRAMALRCRRANVRFDVIVFPFFGDWGPNYRFASCHAKLMSAWRALGVDAVDLQDLYRGIPASELVVNRFDSHPNERAHRMAAETVLEKFFPVR